MELAGIVVLLALAWIALAGVCFWKRRGLWVLVAILVLVAVVIVGVVVIGLVDPFERDGGFNNLGILVGLAFLVIVIAFLSSFPVLAVGAIRPSKKTTRTNRTQPVHFHTRWRGSTIAGDLGAWNRGRQFDSLDDARDWAEGMAGRQAISSVEVFTKGPIGARVVATFEASARPSDATNGEVEPEDGP